MDEVKVVEKEAKQIESYSNSLFSEIKSLEIKDEASLAIGADYLKKLKETAKAIDEREKEFTKPLNDTLKKIRDVFRPQKDAIDNMKSILERDKILPYQRELERRKREEAEREREKEAERLRLEREAELAKALEEKSITKKDAKIEEKIIEKEVKAVEQKEIKIDNSVKTSSGSMNIRKSWTFEIIDASQVDREYCEPSKALIDQAIKNGAREIKGLRIFEKETVVSR